MTLPIRTRLTGWYVGLLAVILAALGIFLPLRLAGDLVAGTDRTLDGVSSQLSQAEAETPSGFQDATDATLSGLPGGESAAQTLSAQGMVVLHSGDVVAQSSMVPAEALRAALGGARVRTTTALGPDHERFRVLAVPLAPRKRVSAGSAGSVLVVSTSLDDVDRSESRLVVLLLTVLPAALLAAAGGGWWLARKALVPVAQITRQAAAIGVDQLHRRVPVPKSSDELARLATTINAMLERIANGVREKHRFLADASHELRTPLAVMRSELEVSLRSEGIDGESRAVLESAAEEVQRMSRIVDDLLTLARIDEGKLDLLRTTVDLSGIAAGAVRDLRPLAEAKNIALEVGGAEALVMADADRLSQAVRNLVENAVKYSEHAGHVDIAVWRRDGEAGLTVTDDGAGISAEILPRIFDRFVREDAARSRGTGGSGLGLAITREIVEAHGGRVWAESAVGSGSSFSVAFPSAEIPESPQVAAR